MKKCKKNRQETAFSKARDMNGKDIFDNPVLCAQFLRDHLGEISFLKDIQPEDIEDVSERFRPFMGTEYYTDSVKKIHIKVTDRLSENNREIPLYLLSIIEHKSQVDYNVAVQMLRYIICIWSEYAKEMEGLYPGISKNKNFRYPPIIPIVYFEGSGRWTADLHLKDRVMLQEVFGEFIPDFTYKVVRIHDYSDEELLSREDEMSFLMLINKIQESEDLSEFLKLPQDKVNAIIQKAPEQVVEIIAATIWSLCMKMNVPQEEAKQCVEKVKERRMGYLFENMEKIDVQAERKKMAEERKKLEAERQEMKAEWQEMKAERQEIELKQQKAELERQKAEAERQRAEQIEKQKEEIIRNSHKILVSLCRQHGISKEETVKELVKNYELSQADAEKVLKLYWKE